MKIIHYGILSFIFCIYISFIFSNANAQIPENEFTKKIISISNFNDPFELYYYLREILEDADRYQRFILLPKTAKTAIRIKSYLDAERYANELLNLADEYKKDWNYGNAIHDANIVLGMVCIENNNIEKAKSYLLSAGKALASPQLKTFGPNMILADKFLDLGENDIVIEYLYLLKKIWVHDDGRLDSWIASVKGGGRPYFGANLDY
jgi:hypothetical protein